MAFARSFFRKVLDVLSQLLVTSRPVVAAPIARPGRVRVVGPESPLTGVVATSAAVAPVVPGGVRSDAGATTEGEAGGGAAGVSTAAGTGGEVAGDT